VVVALTGAARAGGAWLRTNGGTTMDAEAAARPLSLALAQGTDEERAEAYATIEAAARDGAVTLLVACVKPLISLLCAPASRVGVAEWRRACLLLYAMAPVDIAVAAEMVRKDADGNFYVHTVWTAPDSVFAAMLAKEPSEWTREDAITASANMALHVPAWSTGWNALMTETRECGMNGDVGRAAEMYGAYLATSPYESAEAAGRYLALALLCLDLVRSETDEQPAGIIAGAAGAVNWITQLRPALGKELWLQAADFLGVMEACLKKFNPLERVGRRNLVTTGVFGAIQAVVMAANMAGVDVISGHSGLLDSGSIDTAITTLNAYAMLGEEEQGDVCAVQWGALFTLEIVIGSPQAGPIIAKLRSAGISSFRYVLDHPLAMAADFGVETSVHAVRIAALVWGRDDDGGGLAFKQQDIDRCVEVSSHRGSVATYFPLTESTGQPIRELCVS
jgi:hypothetical protein